MNDKKILRKQMITLMKQQNKANKKIYDEILHNQLLSHPLYKAADTVSIVLSMDHEVNTIPIIKSMLQQNKKVFVPRTDYTSKVMQFQRIYDLKKVEIDEKNIRYVNEETEIAESLDLMIVPGVIFNEDGYRIGYGGGYYDKYLSTHQGHSLSLLYPFQLKSFNPESHDIKVETLIIPNELDGDL